MLSSGFFFLNYQRVKWLLLKYEETLYVLCMCIANTETTDDEKFCFELGLLLLSGSHCSHTSLNILGAI